MRKSYSTFNKQSGAALLLTIVLLAVLAVTAALISARTLGTTRIEHEAAVGKKESEALWRNAAAAIVVPNTNRYRCVTNEITSLCFYSNVSQPGVLGKSSLPLWSGASFLKSPSFCLDKIVPPAALNPSALLSARSCAALPPPVGDAIILDGNLFASATVIPEKVRAIFVTGSVVLETLNTQTPLTIFSGGDLQIENLESAAPISIALVTATGDVTVKSVAGPVTISALAAGSVNLPADYTPGDFSGPRPVQIPFLLLGNW